jgi:hypothetical protein
MRDFPEPFAWAMVVGRERKRREKSRFSVFSRTGRQRSGVFPLNRDGGTSREVDA